jgi:excisionase family DNA binding protein
VAPNRRQIERLDEYLTVSQAAVFLGVSPSTLRNWDKAGKVKAGRHPVNGYRLYRREELQKLMEQVKPRIP